MTRMMLKSKIHRATLTGTELYYTGSIRIDQNLLDAADILPNEQVQVVNLNNGSRLITYAISGERGSGVIELNGPAARLGAIGDTIIVISYAQMDPSEAKAFVPSIVYVDKKNAVRLK